jgi:leucyl-tRNA synthetase
MILGEVEYTGAKDGAGSWISYDQIAKDDEGNWVHKSTSKLVELVRVEEDKLTKKGEVFVLLDDPHIRVDSRANKMSKSRGNVVNPDEIVREYGADSLRLYEMFMGPLEATKPWSMNGVSGVRNFLDRVWRLMIESRSERNILIESIQDVAPTFEQNRIVHMTIQAVTRDLDGMSFNTAIARMMEFVNFFTKETVRPQKAMETLVLLLSPFAPHMAEELWEALGHSATLAYEPWPQYDESATRAAEIEVPLQINGKVRAKVVIAAGCSAQDLEKAARNHERIAELLEGKQIVKAIVVPGRMVNFVAK